MVPWWLLIVAFIGGGSIGIVIMALFRVGSGSDLSIDMDEDHGEA